MNQDNFAQESSPSRPPSGVAQETPKAKQNLPEDAMIILPLRNTVLFPSTLMPLVLGRPASVQALKEAARLERPIGFVAQQDASVEEPKPDDLYMVGVVAGIRRVKNASDGQRVWAQGGQRFKILEFLHTEPYLVARVQLLADTVPTTTDFEARIVHLRQEIARAAALLPEPAPELASLIDRLTDPAVLIDCAASWLDVSLAEKQEVLETLDLEARLKKVAAKLARQVEVLEITKKIGSETKEALDRSQREFVLREQLKAIQKELGGPDHKTEENDELRKKLLAAKMPPEVEQEALKELARFERMPEGAAEASMLRTYLDLFAELPWRVATEERIDLEKAREILDADHHGLEKVKKRILEFLAVRKLNPSGKSPILCFVGPPGVGKTSLGQSIAAAMNRKFIRQSLGGVHDEAEIRGHRRTYIGALPGRIIQGIKRAGSKNPVFMLDEIDKLNSSFHGDPSAALLEVLDPEQNERFQDHYLGVPFDLSQALFVATANVLDSIPGPLRDRMEVIELPGYVDDDKLVIAQRYLVPRQLTATGLESHQLVITDEALREVIRGYTREAGVRQLERTIGAICRGVATRFAEGSQERVTVDADAVQTYLGPAKFFDEVALRTSLPGVATGLAWTAVGGEILFVEATKMAGDGKLLLTGQLGDVMKESAQAALSLVKSRAADLGLDADTFKKQDIHVHLPAGAIPKDGPSAGVTLFVALVSLLTGRRVRKDIAMTGEISLRGLVLPVGGIKEKVLAAKRAGLRHVLLPSLNRKDLQELSPAARKALRFEFLETVEDALARALEPAEEYKSARGVGTRDAALFLFGSDYAAITASDGELSA
jgi:ATP-dependent Lon protease